jgi:hypothetical protein
MRLGDLDQLAGWLNVVLASLPIEDYKARTAFSECLVKVNTMEEIKTEPVRHGYWQDSGCYEICSVCGADHDRYDDGGYLQDFAYCPACGAKMDAEEPTNE